MRGSAERDEMNLKELFAELHAPYRVSAHGRRDERQGGAGAEEEGGGSEEPEAGRRANGRRGGRPKRQP